MNYKITLQKAGKEVLAPTDESGNIIVEAGQTVVLYDDQGNRVEGEVIADLNSNLLSVQPNGQNSTIGLEQITAQAKPTKFINKSLSLQHGQSKVLSADDIFVEHDSDGASDLQIQIRNIVGGQFEQVGNEGTAITSFTQADINAGLIQFVQTSDEFLTTFDITVEDTDGVRVTETARVNFTTAAVITPTTQTTVDAQDFRSGAGVRSVVGQMHEGEPEDGAITISDVIIVDPDVTVADVEPTLGDNGFGVFSVVNGEWFYTLNASETQPLAPGTYNYDTITVTASDGSTQELTIRIIGIDDAPEITGDIAGTVGEGTLEAAATVSGELTIFDADRFIQPEFPDVALRFGQSGYGSFSIYDNQWTYTVDKGAVQHMQVGESVEDSVTFVASDGSEQVVTITIEGSNDGAIVTGSTTGEVTEDTVGEVSDQLTITDPDNIDPTFSNTTAVGDNGFGTFVLTDGEWTYTLNHAAVQNLGESQTAEDTTTFTASDGTQQQVSVTIHGTDDLAVVSGPTSGAVFEDGVGTTSGQLTIADVDAAVAPTFADATADGDNGYGTFTLIDGEWTYVVDQQLVQNLNVNQTTTDTTTFTASDGTQQQVTVTIHGAADAAVVTGGFTGTVVEDSVQSATGILNIADTDTSDTPTFTNTTTVGDNAFGTFTLTDGVWNYVLNAPAVQHLNESQIATDSTTFTASDGTQQQITVTIQGTDDLAVVTGPTSGNVVEDGLSTVSGQLSISDVDADIAPTFADTAANGDNGYGSFTLTNGEWTYVLDHNTVQFLADGQTAIDSTTFTASDGTQQTVNVTIQGTDDLPGVIGTTSGSVTEDGATTATGDLAIDDIDAPTPPTFPDTTVSGENGYGVFSLTDGTWTYTLNHSAVQFLAATETASDSVTFIATDGTEQEVVVAIQGTNDSAIVSGTTSGNVVEDGISIANGSISITDADTADTPVFANAVADGDNGYGTFTLADGNWTYQLNQTAAQSIPANQSAIDTTIFTASDGTQQQVTVSILGQDDAPVVAGSYTGGVTEAGLGAAAGTLSITDVDTDSSPSFSNSSVVGDNGYGTFSLTDGNWTYDLNQAAAASLDADEVASDTTTFTATDGTQQTITVQINGVNTTPHGSSIDNASIAEDVTAGTIVGTITALDADSSDTHTIELVEQPGLTGPFEIVNGNQLAVRVDAELDFDTQPNHDVTVRVTDSHGEVNESVIQINLTNVNEGPTDISLGNTGEFLGQAETLNAAEGSPTSAAPELVALSDGGYIKLYSSERELDGVDGRVVIGQRYDRYSNQVGEKFQVSTSSTTIDANVEVVELSDGSFALAFESETGVRIQTISSDFSSIGSESAVQSSSSATNATIEALTGGGFVVAWEESGSTNARIYNSSGIAVTNAISVAAGADPAVAALADGGFMVVFEARGADGDLGGVFAQKFDANGASVSGQFRVNQVIEGDQHAPVAVTRESGEIAVVWQELRADGLWEIKYRDYDNTGASAGDEGTILTSQYEVQLGDLTSLQDNGYWISYTQQDATGQSDIFGWRINPLGVQVGHQANVNIGGGNQFNPRVVELTNEDIVTIWETEKGNGADRAVEHIHRDLTANRASRTASIDGVQTEYVFSHDGDYTPEVVSLGNGGFISFWRTGGGTDGWELKAQLYNDRGQAQGDPSTVHTDVTGDQQNPSATRLSDGGALVAFESDGSILLQQFSENGAATGENIALDAGEMPKITALSDGGYVVAWEGAAGLQIQQFDTTGTAIAPPAPVTTSAVDYAIAGLNDGGYVLTWQNAGGVIVYVKFDESGTPGSTNLVNGNVATEGTPELTALDDGGYLIVWQDSSSDIRAQRYDSNGAADTDFVVNTNTALSQTNPSVISLASGGFLIAWESEHEADQSSEIWAQRFNSDGTLLDSEFQVNVEPQGGTGESSVRHGTPTIVQLDNGDVVFSWHFEDGRGQVAEGNLVRVFRHMVSEDTLSPQVSYILSAADPDAGDSHTFALVSDPSNKFEIVGSELKLKDGESLDNLVGFTHGFDVVISATDAAGVTVQRTVTIDVFGGSDAPENITYDDGDLLGVTNDDYEILIARDTMGGDIVATLGVQDADTNDTHTYQVIENPYSEEFHLFEIVNGNQLAVKPQFTTEVAQRQTHYVQVSVTDSEGYSYMETLTVNVQAAVVEQRDLFLEKDLPYRFVPEVDASLEHAQTPFHPTPRVVALEDGDYYIVYNSDNAARLDTFYAQRYNADGTIDGDKVVIRELTGTHGDATRLDNGNIVVAYNQSKGAPQGDVEFRIFDENFENGTDPVVVYNQPASSGGEGWVQTVQALAGGRFVVTWGEKAQFPHVLEAWMRVFEADGTPVTDSQQLNQFFASEQGWSGDVAATADGGFIATWMSYGADGYGYAVTARKFDINGTPTATEFVVNNTAAYDQFYPSITTLNNGNAIAVWAGAIEATNDSYGIIGRLIDSDGNPLSHEFVINQTVNGLQNYPRVLSLDDGGFFVTWTHDTETAQGLDIHGRRFDAGGTALTGEITLETNVGDQWSQNTTSAQLIDGNIVIVGRDDEGAGITHRIIAPDGTLVTDAEDIFADFMNHPHDSVIITLADGTYVAVNSDGEVWQTVLDADGAPVGGITQVNSVSGGLQFGATAAALNDGGYVVAWSSNDYATEDFSGFGVLLQRYASNGTAIGSPVQVNTSTTGNQNFPDVASLDDGGYIVVWADDGVDGSGWGIQGQRFDSDGRVVGGEFQINAEGADSQWMPKVTGLNDGGYVVTWNSHGQDGTGWGVYAQRYDSNSQEVGGETLVNETTDRGQVAPSIASLADGGYVITWYDDEADGSDFGVMARMYDAAGVPGSEFIVNTVVEGPQLAPVVHGLDNGGFVIAWQGADSREDFTHVYAQRFDEFGNPDGESAIVNSNLEGNNFHPDVTVGADGDIVFTYYYHGAQGGHQLQTRIWEVNDPPTANADSNSVSENATEALTGNVLTNDTDPTNDTLVVTKVNNLNANVGVEIQGTYGTLTIQADGSYAYTVDGAMTEVNSMTDGDSLSESFTYEMSDGQSIATASLQVTINGVNDAPEAGVEISTTAEEFGAFIDLLGNDSDPEGDGPLTVTEIDGSDAVEGTPVVLSDGTMVTLQDGGSVFFDPNGEFDYLEEGETATTSFDYTVEDATGQSTQQTVTVTIEGGESDPVPKAWLSQNQTFYEIGVDPATESVIFTEISTYANPVNALAYNDSNGMLYASDRTDDTLISIDPNTGDISVVADLSAYSGGGGFRGDIDPATNTWYFIADSNTLYALDLDNPSAPATSIGSYSGGADFAFDPLTGLLWSVYSGGTAVRTINPVTGEQQSIGTGVGLPSGTYGGMYADDQGNLVAVNNNGGLYSIDKTTGDAFFIADSSPSNQNDAASPHYGTLVTSLPYLFLDADASSGAAGTSFYTQYNKGGAGASIVDSDVNIFDFDSTVFTSAKIRLLNTYDGDTLSVGALPGTISAIVSTNVDGELEVNFAGTGSDTDWESALYAVTYTNGAVTTDVTPRVFEVTLTDAEGNTSLRARSTVMVSLSTPPVAIDLDGDGVEYVGVEEGVRLDVDGDGQLEQSAWVSPDDAILIYDRDNNDQISGREEYAFADYGAPGATDLEGLRAGFDTDDDLMLTANDAEFDAFRLWQDVDGDGAVGDGELRGLADAGVESIGLESDGVSYRAANGDVLVHGEAEVNFADGSQGVAADASFDFQELIDEGAEPLEIVTDSGEIVNLDAPADPGTPAAAEPIESAADADSSENNASEPTVAPVAAGVSVDAEAAVVAASI